MFYVDNGVTGSRFLQLNAGNHGLCIGYSYFCLFVVCLFVLLLMFYEFNFHLTALMLHKQGYLTGVCQLD